MNHIELLSQELLANPNDMLVRMALTDACAEAGVYCPDLLGEPIPVPAALFRLMPGVVGSGELKFGRSRGLLGNCSTSGSGSGDGSVSISRGTVDAEYGVGFGSKYPHQGENSICSHIKRHGWSTSHHRSKSFSGGR